MKILEWISMKNDDILQDVGIYAAKIVVIVLFIYFLIILAVNFFVHCEHATIFKKYNLCYFYTPTGFHNSSWEIKAPDDWEIK